MGFMTFGSACRRFGRAGRNFMLELQEYSWSLTANLGLLGLPRGWLEISGLSDGFQFVTVFR